MSMFRMDVKHGLTLEEARGRLAIAVDQVHAQLGPMVTRTEWSADRSCVKMSGTGFEADIRVDASEVHVIADIPLLSRLLAGPVVAGLKAIVQKNFQKRLT